MRRTLFFGFPTTEVLEMLVMTGRVPSRRWVAIVILSAGLCAWWASTPRPHVARRASAQPAPFFAIDVEGLEIDDAVMDVVLESAAPGPARIGKVRAALLPWRSKLDQVCRRVDRIYATRREDARGHARFAVGEPRDEGIPWPLLDAMHCAAWLAAAEGDPDAAVSWYRTRLKLAAIVGAPVAGDEGVDRYSRGTMHLGIALMRIRDQVLRRASTVQLALLLHDLDEVEPRADGMRAAAQRDGKPADATRQALEVLSRPPASAHAELSRLMVASSPRARGWLGRAWDKLRCLAGERGRRAVAAECDVRAWWWDLKCSHVLDLRVHQLDRTLRLRLLLELVRRIHGAWPARLSDTRISPALTHDLTGAPLRYRVIDDAPVLEPGATDLLTFH